MIMKGYNVQSFVATSNAMPPHRQIDDHLLWNWKLVPFTSNDAVRTRLDLHILHETSLSFQRDRGILYLSMRHIILYKV